MNKKPKVIVSPKKKPVVIFKKKPVEKRAPNPRRTA